MCWEQLEKTKQCVDCNFSNLDLQHNTTPAINLRNANVSRANFSRAQMADLDFTNASFKNTDLSGVTFYRVNFMDADLSQVKAIGASFHDCRFDGADLRGANFSNAKFEGGSFNLSQIKLNQNTSFSAARFERLNLTVDSGSPAQACVAGKKINFKNVTLGNLTCQTADFESASFNDVVMSGGTFEGASFAKATLWNITTQNNVDLRDIKTNGARLKGDFKNAQINASIKGEGADLTNALFTQTQAKLISGGVEGSPVDGHGGTTYTFVCDRTFKLSSLPFYGSFQGAIVEFFYKRLNLPRTAELLKNHLPMVSALVVIMASYYGGLITEQNVGDVLGKVLASLPQDSVREFAMTQKETIVKFILAPSSYVAFGTFVAPAMKDFREIEYRKKLREFVGGCATVANGLRDRLSKLF